MTCVNRITLFVQGLFFVLITLQYRHTMGGGELIETGIQRTV